MIDFPNNPSANDVFTSGDKTWKFNGTSWVVVGVQARAVSWSDVLNKPDLDSLTAATPTGIIPSYSSASLPWSGTAGQQAFNTTLGVPVYFYNGNWRKTSDDSLVISRVVDIFVLAGQSNAHGHAEISGLTTQQKTQSGLFYTSWHDSTSNAETTQYFSGIAEQLVAGSTRGDSGQSTIGGSLYFGSELGFVNRANSINLTGNTIGILKYAVGASTLNAGTSGSDWDTTATGYKEGDCWRGLQAAIADCVSKLNAAGYAYNFKGLIWWQGESGATVAGLQTFIAAFRNLMGTTYGVPNSSQFPVVITKIGYGNDLTPVAQADAYIGIVDAATYGHSGTNNHIGTSALPDFNGNGINDMFDIGVAYADMMALAIGGQTGTFWEPSPANVTVWADASQLTGLVGGSVTTLADRKSGNPAWNVVGTGATISVQNSKNVVNFSGTADTDYFEQAANMSITTGRQIWYIVAKPTTVNNGQDSMWSQFGGSSITILPSSSTGFLGKAYHSNRICSAGNISASNLVGDFHLIAVDWDVPSNLIRSYLNGTLVETYNPATAATPWTLTMSGAAHKQRLFAQYTSTNPLVLDGFFAEALISTSTSDHQKTEGYLAWKWGIQSKLPAGHPYKNAAP